MFSRIAWGFFMVYRTSSEYVFMEVLPLPDAATVLVSATSSGGFIYTTQNHTDGLIWFLPPLPNKQTPFMLLDKEM